jgi:nucleoside-diphosphate-sugar epimerase
MNYEVFATGSSGTIGCHLPSEVSSLRLDLLSDPSPTLFASSRNINLIHLAGVVGEKRIVDDPTKAYAINVDGTAKLAEVFLESCNGKFTYVSSSHVYKNKEGLSVESDQVQAHSVYAEHKLLAELHLTTLFRDVPHRLLIARVFSILDWHTPPETLGGKVTRLARGKKEPLVNSLDVRDFSTPFQVANLLFDLTTESAAHGVVNVCSGVATTVEQASRLMLHSIGQSLDASLVDSNISERPFLVGNNAKINALLPAYSHKPFWQTLSQLHY